MQADILSALARLWDRSCKWWNTSSSFVFVSPGPHAAKCEAQRNKFIQGYLLSWGANGLLHCNTGPVNAHIGMFKECGCSETRPGSVQAIEGY